MIIAKLVYYLIPLTLVCALLSSCRGLWRVLSSRNFVRVDAELCHVGVDLRSQNRMGARADVPVYMSYSYVFKGKRYESEQIEVSPRGWSFSKGKQFLPSMSALASIADVVADPSREIAARIIKVDNGSGTQSCDQYLYRKVTAYVNPANPSDAFLVHTSPLIFVVGIVSSGIFLCLFRLFRSPAQWNDPIS